MIVFLNGQFVPEEQALVSVFDRSFLYGDGLFETMRVCNGRPFRWTAHWQRFQHGAEFLGIPLRFPTDSLRDAAHQLITRNQMPDSLLRLMLSRGVGVRGYSPKGATKPSLVMSLHPVGTIEPQHPPRWRLVTASIRLPADEPLARFKTSNKLRQILARAEADAANADEALLLSADGCVAEGSASNLFWLEGRTICTPPLTGGILPGVTRAVVLEICCAHGFATREASTTPAGLLQAEGIFLSLSSVGLAEGLSLDGCPLRQSPWAHDIHRAYVSLLQRETG